MKSSKKSINKSILLIQFVLSSLGAFFSIISIYIAVISSNVYLAILALLIMIVSMSLLLYALRVSLSIPSPIVLSNRSYLELNYNRDLKIPLFNIIFSNIYLDVSQGNQLAKGRLLDFKRIPNKEKKKISIRNSILARELVDA